MLRAVLAVLIVAALLAVSQPLITQGRQEHAATLLGEEIDDLVGESRDLIATDEAVNGSGARRIVGVELPPARRFSAGANYVEINGGETPAVEWAVDGGRARRRVLEGLRYRTPDGESLRLAGEGSRRLVLRLVGPPGDPVVAVKRFEPPGDEDA